MYFLHKYVHTPFFGLRILENLVYLSAPDIVAASFAVGLQYEVVWVLLDFPQDFLKLDLLDTVEFPLPYHRQFQNFCLLGGQIF